MYIDNGSPVWNVSQVYAANCGWMRFCASRADASACDAMSASQRFDSPLMIADCELYIVN